MGLKHSLGNKGRKGRFPVDIIVALIGADDLFQYFLPVYSLIPFTVSLWKNKNTFSLPKVTSSSISRM